ncbi:phage tail tape measure protein [Pseudomonas sp. Q2-TVG4-2]|uniref:phage tail tape measure protein n=1 Tax=Pseudomonas sp. Q2-TVG4-2 TaxID=1685699 RepID=UPI002159CD40|nr:phage tail tape measure protein [Pseudomonas sp. Q2-TVG4-2]
MASNDLDVALRLSADSRLLGVGLQRGERDVSNFSRKSQQELRRLSRVSDDVRGHFADMAGSFAKASSGLFVANRIKPGVAVAGDLQEAMLGVKTELMGAVDSALEMDKALQEIKATAFDIQKSTPFDQSQIVNLEKELLKGGAKIEQIVGKQGAAAAAAALAAYEGIDAVMAGENLISIATPFNLAGDQFMMLANQAGAAGSASTASFTSIAEGAKYAAGSMAGLGRDSKEMFALLATLDQGGLKGSMGGTSLSAFFRQAVQVDAFKDANGNLKSTVEILDTLRKRLDGMGTAKRAGFLQKMFGDEGGRAAQILLRQGAGSYEDMVGQMGKAVGLQEKLQERLKGYNAQLESLRGTAKSTFATMFEPALDPLTKLISKTNEWAGALGEAAMENKRIGQVGTGVAAGVAAGGALYGGYHLLKGLASGGKMLGALKGGTQLAGGVAMGKALEEAAGVPSVFVVNMPKSFGPASAAEKLIDAGDDLLPRGKFKGAGKWLGRAAVPLMLATSGLEAYNIATDDRLTSQEKSVGYSGVRHPGRLDKECSSHDCGQGVPLPKSGFQL